MSATELKLFISHLSANKLLATELAAELRSYNILPFVAHEDIAPTKAWQEEIEAFLNSAHCMLALLHKGYFESIWCNQEIGYCMGKGIPIVCMRIEEDPKGFLAKWQAYSPKSPLDAQWEAHRIRELILGKASDNAAIRAWVVNCFSVSGSFATSNRLCDALQGLTLTNSERQIIKAAFHSNSQVSGARNMPNLMGPEWVKDQWAAMDRGTH